MRPICNWDDFVCYCGVVVFGHGAIQQCNQSNLLFSSVVLTDKGKKAYSNDACNAQKGFSPSLALGFAQQPRPEDCMISWLAVSLLRILLRQANITRQIHICNSIFGLKILSSIGLWCRWYHENPIIPVTYFRRFFSYTCVSNITAFPVGFPLFIALITFHRSPLLANLELEDKWKI